MSISTAHRMPPLIILFLSSLPAGRVCPSPASAPAQNAEKRAQHNTNPCSVELPIIVFSLFLWWRPALFRTAQSVKAALYVACKTGSNRMRLAGKHDLYCIQKEGLGSCFGRPAAPQKMLLSFLAPRSCDRNWWFALWKRRHFDFVLHRGGLLFLLGRHFLLGIVGEKSGVHRLKWPNNFIF